MTTRQIELNQSLSHRASIVSTYPYKNESKSSFSWMEYDSNKKNSFPSSNNTSSSQNTSHHPNLQDIQPQIPSVSITSWIFFFKRIILGFFSLPIMLFLTPCILAFIWICLREISNNHPILFVFGALAMHTVTQQQIEFHAPNQEEAKKAIRRSRIWLPLFCVVVTIIGCRQLGLLFKYVPFISGMMSIANVNSIHRSIAFFTLSSGWGFYFASIGLLLNLAVIVRFVGPFAIGKLIKLLKDANFHFNFFTFSYIVIIMI